MLQASKANERFLDGVGSVYSLIWPNTRRRFGSNLPLALGLTALRSTGDLVPTISREGRQLPLERFTRRRLLNGSRSRASL